MRIDDVLSEYRDLPMTRALLAERPTPEQREALDALDRAHRRGEACVVREPNDAGRRSDANRRPR